MVALLISGNKVSVCYTKSIGYALRRAKSIENRCYLRLFNLRNEHDFANICVFVFVTQKVDETQKVFQASTLIYIRYNLRWTQRTQTSLSLLRLTRNVRFYIGIIINSTYDNNLH